MKNLIFVALFPLYLSSMPTAGPSVSSPLLPSLKEMCLKFLAKIEPSHEELQGILPQDLIDDLDEELFTIYLSFLEREMMFFPLYLKYNIGPATSLDLVLFCNRSEWCAKLHFGQQNSAIYIMKEQVVREHYNWKSCNKIRALIKQEEFVPGELWKLVPKNIIMNVAYSIRRG